METTLTYVDSEDFRSLPESVLLADPVLRPPREHAPAGTPPYLAALYDYPLLTREQEFQWFRKMNYLRFLAAKAQSQLTLSRLNVVRLEHVESLLQQAEEIRNRVVQCNLRLVVSIAKSLVDYANSLDDLISEGNLPLIRAVEIFDFTRGLRFSTYATWAVRNGLFRVSTRNRKQRQRFWASDPDRFERHGPSSAPIDEESLTAEERTRLLRLVNRLDPRSQTIVRERFGLAGRDQKPARFRELADKLRLSTERVRQLLARALDNLRDLSEGSSSRQAG